MVRNHAFFFTCFNFTECVNSVDSLHYDHALLSVLSSSLPLRELHTTLDLLNAHIPVYARQLVSFRHHLSCVH